MCSRKREERDSLEKEIILHQSSPLGTFTDQLLIIKKAKVWVKGIESKGKECKYIETMHNLGAYESLNIYVYKRYMQLCRYTEEVVNSIH